MRKLIYICLGFIPMVLSACARSMIGHRAHVPSEKNPEYLLWTGLTPLERRPPGIPRKTLMEVQIRRPYRYSPILVKYSRKIEMAGFGVKMGMDGDTVWVNVRDDYEPLKQWRVEFERIGPERFLAPKEKGTVLRY